MKLLMFSVFDSAVGAFLPPLYFRARGEALRSFSEAVNREGENMKRYPHDYTFMFLGEFDDASGVFSAVIPERVIGGLECVLDGVQPPGNRSS